MNTIKKTILIVALYLIYVNASDTIDRQVVLQVVEPDSIKQVFAKYNNQIPNYLSPYGIIPYGKQIKGMLELANPINGCKKLEYDHDQNPSERPFLIIEVDSQDSCGIEERLFNAQIHGAQLVILILKENDINETWKNNIKKLKLISIPIIQVNREVGQSLVQIAKDLLPDNKPTLTATFPTKDHTQNCLQIFADINNIQTYSIFRLIHQYNSIHDDKYNISIYYNIPDKVLIEQNKNDDNTEDQEERKETQQKYEKFCFGSGQYCDKENQTIMKEIIRQTCIFNSSPSDYFKYVRNIQSEYKIFLKKNLNDLYQNGDQNYFDFDKMNQQSIQQIENQELSSLQEICYNNSFIESYDSQAKQTKPLFQSDNYILANHFNYIQSQNFTSNFPIVLLNNQEILQSKNKNYTLDVLQKLCETDKDAKSNMCLGLYQVQEVEEVKEVEEVEEVEEVQEQQVTKKFNSRQQILIFGGLLISTIIVCCFIQRYYNNYQKKKYSKELQRVDQLVQSYIELNQDVEKQQQNDI